MGKTKEAEPDLNCGPRGSRYKKKSVYTLAELLPRQRKGSNKHFFYFFIPDLVMRPTAAMITGKNHH